MRSVQSHEAETELMTLLDDVESGAEVVITRQGRPVARLVADAGTVDQEKAIQAVADILAMREGATLGGDVTIKQLINEGRR